MKYAIKDNIKNEAAIKTDAYHSYKKLAKQMKNITYGYSETGIAMEELHKQIMQFKNWLRGMHHQCSRGYLFVYTDEYVYRFNKRNMRRWLFNDVVVKLMQQFTQSYNF